MEHLVSSGFREPGRKAVPCV